MPRTSTPAGPRARATKRAKAKPQARRSSPAKARPNGKAKSDANEGLAFRLPASLMPEAYRLYIDVDPARSQSYLGRVEIDCRATSALSRFELHASELEIQQASVARGKTTVSASANIELQPERETIALTVPKILPKGKLRLELSFAGQLRGDLRGLYAARSGERSYAFTQLEAADARRFFPCFDEPSHKATYQVSVRTAEENTVISNSPIAQTDSHGDGYKTVHFEPTPKLSTYLVALAVGELEISETVYAGEVPIRIVHVPGNGSMTAFALDTARETLTRLRDYFALPYPYAKLDLVAVPDFEIGAMENAGAVFFRETLLLVDEASVSLTEKKRAAEVICHELAHMWYGNLVTMRWWDDLWLNEAFATWMAFDIVAKWRPEWQMWNDFGHSRNSALALDALDNTHPIYTEVRTPSEATENFDVITYEKGAAVVRMLERYLGPKTFQRGVRRYIKRHRESNTVARDLWNALSEAAGEDVTAVVRPFIEQPGFPVVSIERKRVGKEQHVRLSQARFYAQGPEAKPESKSRWQVPWVGRVGQAKAPGFSQAKHLLTKTRDELTLRERDVPYLYGNADEGGFFRPLHHPRDLPALFEALPQLSTTERLGFVHHQWALVSAGYAGLDTFLPLIAALAREPEADVLRALLPACDCLVADIARAAGPKVHAALQAHVIEVFGPALAELAWTDDYQAEPIATRLRRAELLQLVALIAESTSACEAAEARCAAYLEDRSSLDPNLIATVLAVGVRGADRARLEQLLDASEREPTPQARRRFRLSICDVRDPVLVREVLQVALQPRIPTQDVAFVVARLLRNPQAQEIAFEFMQERWSELKTRMPAMLVSRLIDATPALRSEAHRRAVARFFAKHPVPTAARALRQADERFRLDAAFRKRAVPELRAWLKARKS